MSSSKRGAWQAENDQDGGSQSGSTGSKVDPARSGKVVEPEPAAVTADVDGDGETDPGPKAGRTGKVTDPARD
ncbi:MAG: hypothetical protein ABUT39_23670 [Acidobacteriota bacterium]